MRRGSESARQARWPSRLLRQTSARMNSASSRAAAGGGGGGGCRLVLAFALAFASVLALALALVLCAFALGFMLVLGWVALQLTASVAFGLLTALPGMTLVVVAAAWLFRPADKELVTEGRKSSMKKTCARSRSKSCLHEGS
eukprot:4425588-Pleurochrysis_carterae.AAC.2